MLGGAQNSGRFRYTGQIFIPEIGLYHYKARAYSPGLGRFMQTDPIGYGDGLNMYGYVGNDAVNGVDPMGLSHTKTKTCTGTRVRQETTYDCNALFTGTSPYAQQDPNTLYYTPDATLSGSSGSGRRSAASGQAVIGNSNEFTPGHIVVGRTLSIGVPALSIAETNTNYVPPPPMLPRPPGVLAVLNFIN